jgi:hypothetical protein
MQFVHKAEEALTGKTDESHDSIESSNHGPHSSNLANKLDPRVDSGHGMASIFFLTLNVIHYR